MWLKSIEELTKPILYFSKIYGSAPYSIKQNNSVQIQKKLKWFDFIFYASLLIIEIYLQIYNVKIPKKTNHYHWLGTFNVTCMMTLNIVNCIQIMTKHGCVKKVLEEILNLNRIIQLREKDPKKSSTTHRD